MSTTHRPSLDRLIAPAGAAVLAALLGLGPTARAETAPVRIAVFDFELNDRSAGAAAGTDAVDRANLKASTDLARQMLAASGRYDMVDPASVEPELAAAGGVNHCSGCEGALARKLGATQSMVGLITRVNRTEYTMQIMVRDAQSGAVVSNEFTGLRMGANYAWPRGVKWLMDNRILAAR